MGTVMGTGTGMGIDMGVEMGMDTGTAHMVEECLPTEVIAEIELGTVGRGRGTDGNVSA
jgi:hypothetical protein